MTTFDQSTTTRPDLTVDHGVGPADVEPLFSAHLAEQFAGQRLAELQQQFAAEHVVPLRGVLPPSLLSAIRDEAFAIMDRHGIDRDLVFEVTGNTPRRMTTVGQPVIKEHGPLIDAFYFSPSLLQLAGQVVGEQVHTCPYAGEHYVISQLRNDGDTHGFHWDDYTYGVILVLEAPHYTQGGFVQAVPNTSWDKANPDVYGALLDSHVKSYAFEAGDGYLIRTNTTMHRVHPISGEGRRTIVNMTLASTPDLDRDMDHSTNDVLFGGTRTPAR